MRKIATQTNGMGNPDPSAEDRVDGGTPPLEAIGTVDESRSVIRLSLSRITKIGYPAESSEVLATIQRDSLDLRESMLSPGTELLSVALSKRYESVFNKTRQDKTSGAVPVPNELIPHDESSGSGALHLPKCVAWRAGRRPVFEVKIDP